MITNTSLRTTTSITLTNETWAKIISQIEYLLENFFLERPSYNLNHRYWRPLERFYMSIHSEIHGAKYRTQRESLYLKFEETLTFKELAQKFIEKNLDEEEEDNETDEENENNQ